MKKISYLFVCTAIMLLGSGCSKKTKNVTKTTIDNRDKLIPWSYKNAKKPYLSDGEIMRVQFYVSEEIKMERVTSHTTGTPQGGKLPSTETKTTEDQIIDIRLKGEAVLIQRDQYDNIVRMLVSFDSSSYTYNLWFKRKKDGFMYLEGKGIKYPTGEDYKLYADPDCHLLFDPDKTKVEIVIKRKAKGNTVSD